MYQPVLPQYFVDPIQSTKQVIDVKNALVAQQDQAESRRGFEEAYRAKMDPQSTWQAPIDASYSYTQGNAAANELFNQQQQQFVNQNIMPALRYAAETGDNKPFEYLQGKMDSFKAQPFAGQGVKLLESLQGISFNKPGEVDGVTLTPETMKILKSNDPAINQLLQNMAGQKVNLKLQNGMVTNVITPKTSTASTKIVEVKKKDGKPHKVLIDALGNEIKDLGLAKEGSIGLKGFVQHKTIPGAFFNRADGKTYMDIPDDKGGTKRTPLDSMTVQEQSRYWPTEMQKAKQQGGQQAVNAYVTADTYKAEAAELKALRDKIMNDNPSAFSGVGSKIRKMNRISQLAQLETGDNPDLAEFIKGTTLLADLLQKAVGGTQGGQWAFELASKLLDPTMPPNAYDATIDKHMRTLETKARLYAGAGTTPGGAGYKERPKIPGEKQKDDIRVGGFYKNKKILRTGRDDKGNTYVQLEGIKDPVRVR